MAMSRLPGARCPTGLPSWKISPLVASSRPARMRSSVVLPQPLGPTSVTNSRSENSRSMSRSTLTSPNDLLMCSMRIVIAPLPLDRAGAEARYKMPLHQHEEDRHGHGHQHGGGHEQPPVHVHALEEEHHPHRERQLLGGIHEHTPEEEVVPGHDEREDAGGDDARERRG